MKANKSHKKKPITMKLKIESLSTCLTTLLLAGAVANLNAAVVSVDPAALTSGYMNWFNLPPSGTFPANPYGSQAGQAVWGLADLVSSFSASGLTNVVTLSPNNIADPDPFWYVGGGADGNPGNKIMDANLYNETTGVYTGQPLTFTGVVYSNGLLKANSTNQQGNGWTAYAFIKDFAADYSSSTQTNILLTNVGTFSLTKVISSDPGHHIQYGFETFGPCVWPTDPILPGLGDVQVGAVVFSQPVISIPPAAAKVALGNSATFSVTAAGDITGYQWKTNGVNLPEDAKYGGTQTPTLTISDCQLSDAKPYSVTVSGPGGSASATNSLTVIDPSKMTINPADSWSGFMNVTGTEQSPGDFGTGWGVADLKASFSGSQLVLSPNTIGDPNCYWYYNPSFACEGAGTNAGAIGAKTMEANMYVESTGVFQGANVTFSGTVLNTNLLNSTSTNQLGSNWTCIAFIKDFAPNYSSFNSATVDLGALASPVFSVTLLTLDDAPGRHVQIGFATKGPNVWATDPILPGLGQVVIAPNPAVVITARLSGTSIDLSFPSVIGYSYTVQYKNKLNDANWTNLSPATPGTGSTVVVTDTHGLPNRFYRVAVQ
jgi:hypothetical protein